MGAWGRGYGCGGPLERLVTALDRVIVRNSPHFANCSLANESASSGVGSPSAGFYWPSYLTNQITVFNQAIRSKCQLANHSVLCNEVIRGGR